MLYPRQTEVLRLFGRGNSSKEIASILSITKNTVSTHLYRTGKILKLNHDQLRCWAARELTLIECGYPSLLK